MKFYKDNQNTIFHYPDDGSQDHLIGNKIPITEQEVNDINEKKFYDMSQKLMATLSYSKKRKIEYPEMAEFLDAWVKNDQSALEQYRQKCLEVKAKFPKPVGF